jgi:hypothetical protein
MITAFPKKENGAKREELSVIDAGTILKMNVKPSPVTSWFHNITKAEKTSSDETCITVIDKGSSVEFILPKGTAQFAKMSVLDTRGKLVWKTQTLNENIIVWPKQTTVGQKVPGGRYVFQMKQGDRQADGVAMIA